MRRAGLLAGAALLAALGLPAQQHPASVAQKQPEAEGHSAAHGPAHVDLWKLANFALFLGALAYFLRGRAAEFFRARSEQIRRDIQEAARLKQEAEERCAAIERRLAEVENEIEKLRRQAQEEAQAEEARLRRQIELDIGKIKADAEQEIAAAVKAARQQLRARAAELAVELAAREIRQGLTPEVEDRLLRRMVNDLERRAPGVS